MKNGRYAMRVLCGVVEGLEPDVDMRSFVSMATDAFRREYQSHRMGLDWLRSHPEERLCASVVVYSCMRKEIWMVGDCQCLVDGVLHDNPKRSEEIVAEERSRIAKRLLAGGMSVADLQRDDLSRQAILPHLVDTMKEENIGYSVIDGFPVPMDKTRLIDCVGARTIVLASDGYPLLCPTLEESEKALALQLENDPLNIGKFKATKGLMAGNVSFDDRSYIRFSVGDACVSQSIRSL